MRWLQRYVNPSDDAVSGGSSDSCGIVEIKIILILIKSGGDDDNGDGVDSGDVN